MEPAFLVTIGFGFRICLVEEDFKIYTEISAGDFYIVYELGCF